MSLIVKERLAVIRENHLLLANDIISLLRESRLITENYSERCLSVDFWFLCRPQSVKLYKNWTNTSIIHNPIRRLFFSVFVNALVDYGHGRPCDLKAWRLDEPPDRVRCTDSHHICRENAFEFLTSVTSSEELAGGLSPGTLLEFIDLINRSKKYQSSQIKDAILE